MNQRVKANNTAFRKYSINPMYTLSDVLFIGTIRDVIIPQPDEPDPMNNFLGILAKF